MSGQFHARHAEAYGFANESEPTQFVNLRLTAIGKVDRPTLRVLPSASDSAERALKGRRQVYFAEGRVDCAIYDRDLLLAGDVLDGPAIIEQMDSTTVVPPSARVEVERHGNLIITVSAASEGQ